MAATAGLDPQTAVVLADLEGPGVPGISEMSPVAARQWMADFIAKWDLDPKPEISSTQDFEMTVTGSSPGVIPLRLYRPADTGAGPLPIVVFFHAGGYVFGSIDTHESFCRLLTRESGCLVLSVGYRMAPEYKFPVAHEDCLDALLWADAHAAELGADPAKIVVGGDSSGGTLAIAVCQMAHARGGPPVSQLMLWYPGTAGGGETASMRELSEGYFLTAALMKWSMGHYLNGPSEMADPRVAPLQMEDFGILPPTFLLTAGFDPRRDDNRMFVDRLLDAGVEAEFHCIDNTIHGFMFMLGGIDLAIDAVNESAAYLGRRFAIS